MKKNLLFTFLLSCMSFITFAQSYQIGDVAEDFNLPNVSGHMLSMDDYKGVNGYIIVFTCNHCPYSIMYENRLIELHHMTSEMGYPVIAINPNDPAASPADSFEKMQERHKERQFPFAYLFDEGQKVYPKFGATKTPHVFVLDQDKKVRYIGAVDDNARDELAVSERYVLNAVMALSKGKNPSPETTKAIGCSIKKVKK